MGEAAVIQIIFDTVKITLLVLAPFLTTALLAGLLVSVFQVVTSIQDMTLSFVPRIVAVFVVALLIFPWVLDHLKVYTIDLILSFTQLAQ